MAVIFGSHELLTSLVRSIEDGGSISHADEIAVCVARINACLGSACQTSWRLNPP